MEQFESWKPISKLFDALKNHCFECEPLTLRSFRIKPIFGDVITLALYCVSVKSKLIITDLHTGSPNPFCPSINYTPERKRWHWRWHSVDFDRDHYGNSDERWPMEATSNMYFRGVLTATYLGSFSGRTWVRILEGSRSGTSQGCWRIGRSSCGWPSIRWYLGRNERGQPESTQPLQ